VGSYFTGVVVAGAVSVLVEFVVVVSVVAVPVDAAVPVSSTTGVSVVVVSFFWQPVESATAAMAARPRVRNFFINLISFLLQKALSSGARG